MAGNASIPARKKTAIATLASSGRMRLDRLGGADCGLIAGRVPRRGDGLTLRKDEPARPLGQPRRRVKLAPQRGGLAQLPPQLDPLHAVGLVALQASADLLHLRVVECPQQIPEHLLSHHVNHDRA